MAKHVIVVGGGVSGLCVAWRLAEQGTRVSLLEACETPGGLAGTVRKDRYCLDYGPHSFFSDSRDIVDVVLSLFNTGLQPVPRRVKFFYEGKYIDYPLTARSALFQMGLVSGLRSAASFLKASLIGERRPAGGSGDETVEEWAISHFGEHLYRTFFKPYTEQFWKVPCTELSSRSIPTHTRMSFTNTLRLLLHRKVSHTGESLIEREMRPTYYPSGGFSEIAARIAAEVTKSGGDVRFGCAATAIELTPEGGVRTRYVRGGRHEELVGNHVISTIPLPLLARMLEPRPPRSVLESAGKLDYRALVVLGMVTRKQDILGAGYIYHLNRPYNRVFEMNSFSPLTSPAGENILGAEIPCHLDSSAWRAGKEELFDMCIGSLAEDGFLAPGDVTGLLTARAPYAYPIYRRDYATHLDNVMGHIDGIGPVSTLGRCGEFIYMDIDDCMKRAFAFAEARRDTFAG